MDEVLMNGAVQVRTTPDGSRTRLVLDVRTYDAVAFLDVTDVQDLAGVLLQWLAVNGHALPLIPALEDDDPDEPVTLSGRRLHVLPEHRR